MTLTTIRGPLNVLEGIQLNGVPLVNGGSVVVDEITDATTIGKAILKAADGPAVVTAIGAKPSTYVPAWAEITGKPATFPPIIGAGATDAKAGNYVPAWAEITGKPATFPPEIGVTATTAMAGNTAIPAASSTAPAALAAAAAVGVGTTFARADHVHALPTDTALQVAAFVSDGGALNFPGGTLAAAIKAIADLADPG